MTHRVGGLWDRGLSANPALRYPYVEQPEQVRWIAGPDSDMSFIGGVASDGSLIGSWRDLSRTGWAGAMLSPAGDRVALAIYGPLPTALPVQRRIARAELHAVLQVLRHSAPPLRLHVDCALVLNGIANGRAWCVHSSRPHADVWRRIWDVLDDIGDHARGPCEGASGHSVIFFGVKAHVSARGRRDAAPATRRLLDTNTAADKYAKEGACAGTNDFLQYVHQSVGDRAAMVTGALDHIAGLATHVLQGKGAWSDVAKLPKRGEGTAMRHKEPRRALRHLPVSTAFGIRCARCFGSGDIAGGTCRPHPAAKLTLDHLGRFALVRGHRLWRTGGYVWCSVCAAHSRHRIRELGRPCPGGTKQVSVRRNLLAGRAPMARAVEPHIGIPARLTVDAWLAWKFELSGEKPDIGGASEAQGFLDDQQVAGEAEPGRLEV